MFYVQNVLKYLNKHYDAEKVSKKKIHPQEIAFCKKIIKQIDQFCFSKDRQRYEKFKSTNLTVDRYVSKYKVKDVSAFKRLVRKFHNAETKVSNYDIVKAQTFERFTHERQVKGEAVHHRDLQRWSSEISQRMGLKKRCASISFANSIKKKYRIVCRFVQQKRNFTRGTEEDRLAEAEAFVHRVNPLLSQFDPALTFNADQTGVNYEASPKRTLEVRNTKLVAVNVRNVNRTTHSYTVQLCCSASGALFPKLFVVLQEKDGVFGPRVQPSVDELVETSCTNLIVRCTSSGKMNQNLLREWVDQFEAVHPDRKLLLWDSWSPQRPALYENENLKIEQIPPKTTKYCQPLDSLFMIQWKAIYKHLFFLLNRRRNVDRILILKINSVVHNQLSHPHFESLIKAAWSSCGFRSDDLQNQHESYAKVNELFLNHSECQMEDCCSSAAIRCIHCGAHLCVSHLIEEIHLHL